MTHNKFRRSLVNGGWSCYNGGNYVSYNRGRANIEVETDTDDWNDGYFELNGDIYYVSDVRYVSLFPNSTVLWMDGGYCLKYFYY